MVIKRVALLAACVGQPCGGEIGGCPGGTDRGREHHHARGLMGLDWHGVDPDRQREHNRQQRDQSHRPPPRIEHETQCEQPEQREHPFEIMHIVEAPQPGRQQIDISEHQDDIDRPRRSDRQGHRSSRGWGPPGREHTRAAEQQPRCRIEQPDTFAEPGAWLDQQDIGLPAEPREIEAILRRIEHVRAGAQAVDRHEQRGQHTEGQDEADSGIAGSAPVSRPDQRGDGERPDDRADDDVAGAGERDQAERQAEDAGWPARSARWAFLLPTSPGKGKGGIRSLFPQPRHRPEREPQQRRRRCARPRLDPHFGNVELRERRRGKQQHRTP
ncbi:hypothetical protein D9M73_120600 [compost metagenome]